MESIEPYIVSIIIQLSNMRNPITVSPGLQLCNSIIMGTMFKEVIDQFKKRTCQSATAVLRPWLLERFLEKE
jgi:hypothetical protein